jgi:hypothetical protein
MPNYKSNVGDYDLMYIAQTEKVICVKLDKESEMFWLPKSQIEFEDKNYKRHQTIKVTIPDWLAEKYELI